jgi:hypothetical protein
MCEVPFAEAPGLFGTIHDPKGYPHCYVKCQPQTEDEFKKMLKAIRCAELMCIRYRGDDRRIQLQLVEADTGFVCDNLPADLQKRVDEQETGGKRLWQKLRKGRQSSAQVTKPWWKFWG